MYLARAAAYAKDWDAVARAGGALTQRSPREAFNAACKLNRAKRALQAAEIFAALDIRKDWFDANIASLAWKEAISLLMAGQKPHMSGDIEQAKVIWVAGARIAPTMQALQTRVSELAFDANRVARRQDAIADPVAYIQAWREVLWFSPSDRVAAAKIARASERLGETKAIDAWLTVLAIDPEDQKANQRLRQLTRSYDLEDLAIRGLVEQGRDEKTDPLVLELAGNRDAKVSETRNKILKIRLRQALDRARTATEARDQDPRRFLEAWKQVLVLAPTHAVAARKVVSAARQLGDQAELLEGLIALLEIGPSDAELGLRLASAGRRAGQEQRALEHLGRHGLADLSVEKIRRLHDRVLRECRQALNAREFDRAVGCFQTLELVDGRHLALEPLRPLLANKAAASAKAAEKDGNFAVAVPLAQQILKIVPDQPAALLIVARDLFRHKQVGELIELCGPRVKSGPEYGSVRKLLDRAKATAYMDDPGSEKGFI